MIHTAVDCFNILLRSSQHDIFQKEMEGVVIGLHCRPFPLQRWVVHQSKLQYLWRYSPCDLEVSGTIAQWLALISEQPMPKGGCTLKGETAYLKGLQAALEKQKNLYQESIPASVRSCAHHLSTLLAQLLPPSPFVQRASFEEGQHILRRCFDSLSRTERACQLYEQEQ